MERMVHELPIYQNKKQEAKHIVLELKLNYRCDPGLVEFPSK